MRAPVALGLRARKGGALAVAIALEQSEPRLVFSTELATHAEGDALSFEPYRVAFHMPRAPDGGASPEAIAAVAEGRKRQDDLAGRGLRAILDELAPAGEARVAALLVNRAGWIADLFDYSLGWADHVPVAELLAVREALRAGCRAAGLALSEQDEKSLADRAGTALGLSAEELDARLRRLGAAARPWRKEHRLAALAAWVALAGEPPGE